MSWSSLKLALQAGGVWVSHWSTSRHGRLFDLLGLGDIANPLVVLDEIDKAARSNGTQNIDMLGQLYGALETETSRRLMDASLNVVIDASQVMYIATANGLENLDDALLSRFEVLAIGMPSEDERRNAAAQIAQSVLVRLGARSKVHIRPGSFVVLAGYSPRVITRTIERVVADALRTGRSKVDAFDFEVALGISDSPQPSSLH